MKIEQKLLLMCRFSESRVKKDLIPAIEQSCLKYKNDAENKMFSQSAYEIFSEHKFAKNCMYLFHDYAYSDIAIGQKFEYIALTDENRKIINSSKQKCKAKILCSFDKYRLCPQDYIWSGHSGLVLIEFEDTIPEIINELYEIDREKYIKCGRRMCLLNDEDICFKGDLSVMYAENGF